MNKENRYLVYALIITGILLFSIIGQLHASTKLKGAQIDSNITSLNEIVKSKGYWRGAFGRCLLQSDNKYFVDCAELLTYQQLRDFNKSSKRF